MKHTLLALGLCALTLPLQDREQKVLERGRACCQLFYEGELDDLWAEFDESMRGALGSPEKLKQFHQQTQAQLGAEVSLVEESAEVQDTGASYSRKARFAKAPMVIEVAFSFDARNRITSFVVRPVPKEAPSEFLAYETKTALRLPFAGEWFVFWGGRSLAQNYHAAVADQRFAYDIVIMRDGSTHTGEGKRNEDYHCFDQPIYAPAAGVVVAAENGIADNIPGHGNPLVAAGNHVVIDHGNGEYSMLAHFRMGTVGVMEGDRVELGALLGLCGNSGNSSEPHLHYHLQNTPRFHDGQGLPAQFLDYLADGEPVARGEPLKGQRIQRRPSEPEGAAEDR